VDISEIVWVGVFVLKSGWGSQAILELIYGMGLIAIIVIKKENRQLSNLMLLLLGMLSVIYLLAFMPKEFPLATVSFLVGAAILFIYNLLKILVKASPHMDFSEIKFGAILGLFLGLRQIILCLFLALFAGATIGSFNIKFRRNNSKNLSPDFSMLMAASALATILIGQDILNVYTNLIR
jgi:prepilin signal peptidase PulO-like enzyme (type II secretory pathway)